MEEQHSKLASAVIEAAGKFNHAVNCAADAGILVEISVENEDPELTLGSIPRQKLIVNVYQKDQSS